MKDSENKSYYNLLVAVVLGAVGVIEYYFLLSVGTYNNGLLPTTPVSLLVTIVFFVIIALIEVLSFFNKINFNVQSFLLYLVTVVVVILIEFEALLLGLLNSVWYGIVIAFGPSLVIFFIFTLFHKRISKKIRDLILFFIILSFGFFIISILSVGPVIAI